MNWYLKVLKKYKEFEGRAGRKEFWYALLINFIVMALLGGIDRGIGTFSEASGVGLLHTLYALAVFLPMLAVQVRRLHDTNRSGWWVLIGLVPVIGWIVLVFFSVQKGTEGENQYGDDPQTVLVENT
ncbi:MAG: DUF805 domain-containing protein [Candidatus Electrothrix sp. ATG2]|nr:DUF805 domain-containing protein [Candidatus Electrothrix sp. ATG2]